MIRSRWANQLLLARALAAAGRGAEAAKVHSELFAHDVRGPVFWREVAVLGARRGYTPDPALLKAVTEACAKGECLDSTRRWPGGSNSSLSVSSRPAISRWPAQSGFTSLAEGAARVQVLAG
jgi:hypothetical protein